jgi:hypothetical protein
VDQLHVSVEQLQSSGDHPFSLQGQPLGGGPENAVEGCPNPEWVIQPTKEQLVSACQPVSGYIYQEVLSTDLGRLPDGVFDQLLEVCLPLLQFKALVKLETGQLLVSCTNGVCCPTFLEGKSEEPSGCWLWCLWWLVIRG